MSDVGGPQPAGWYPDPHAPETGERYWSGRRWTAMRRAAGDNKPAGAAESESAGRVDNTWAWLAALSPLLILLFALAFPDQPSVALYGPAVAGVVAGFIDLTQLAKAGRSPGTLDGLAALLVLPVYLILRTRRAPTPPLIPVTWGVSVLVVLAVGNIAAGAA